jgi:hypothetical protein
MSEILNSSSEKLERTGLHPDVQMHLEKIPSFLEVILVMPQNPAAITERINKYRSLKAANDEKKLQSIHDYYSQVS